MQHQSENGYSTSNEDFKLWRLLDHTRYAISRSREHELAQYGLTPEQAYVLDILTRNGGFSTINDIVDKTLRQHHTISTLIKRMETKGLVKKKQDLTDGRKYEILITGKGKKLFKKVTIDSIVTAFYPLSPEEKQELNSHLRRLLTESYKRIGRDIEFTEESMIRNKD